MNRALIISAIAIVSITAIFLLKGKIVHEKFNSQIWKTADLNKEENWSLRWDMMNDLRNKHKLVGMSKKDIIELLGKPNDSTKSEFRYYLGYSKSGINTGTLTITFDEKEIVSDVNVWKG